MAKSPLDDLISHEMDPSYKKKQIAYSNALKAINIAWEIVSKQEAGTINDQVKQAIEYAKAIKAQLDEATKVLYG